MKLPNNRRGCTITSPALLSQLNQSLAKKQFESELDRVEKIRGPVVYWNSKLSHSGIIGYKSFENTNRHHHAASLANLLNTNVYDNYILFTLTKEFKAAKNDDERCHINDNAIDLLDGSDYTKFLQHTHQTRLLNSAQSRKIASLSKKLAFYTQIRRFKSKKSGSYSMRVAFLTLTAPATANPLAVCKAFNHFLDYLQRTANCVYVWKKELGEASGNLHFHIIINNFIPYYIISWKWKRLLLAENVTWTLNADGVESNSHSRIELPRNRRQTAHYIAKYMSKAYGLPGEYGYISGHSSVLDELKEISLIENDAPPAEIKALCDHFKVIRKDFVSIICCDLLEVAELAPELSALFEKQYIEFSQRVTLPQKFHYV